MSHPTKKNPDSGDKNPEDFSKIPGIKIPKLRKIPNPGDNNPEPKKNPESRGFAKNPGDFQKIPKKSR